MRAALRVPFCRNCRACGAVVSRAEPCGARSFWLDLETPLELERLAISNERPLTQFSVSTFKSTRFLMTFLADVPKHKVLMTFVENASKTYRKSMFCNHSRLCSASLSCLPELSAPGSKQKATPNHIHRTPDAPPASGLLVRKSEERIRKQRVRIGTKRPKKQSENNNTQSGE